MPRSLKFLLPLPLLLLAACGPDRTLDEAIQCNQFKRLPDGTWLTTEEVSLDYKSNDVHYQTGYRSGTKIVVDTAKEEREAKDVPKVLEKIIGKMEPQGAALVAALDKKCAAKK